MEDDKKGSMSDKDRKMAGLFEGFGRKKDETEEKKGKKTSKIPKRSLFLAKDEQTPKVESATVDETSKSDKKNLFSGLFKDKEIAVVDIEPRVGDVSTEFQELVVGRLQEVEKELELPKSAENAQEVIADAEFLEHVGERLDEGMEPEMAIDDALEDVYQPPDIDANSNDLENPENFMPVPEEESEVDPATTASVGAVRAPAPIPPVWRPNSQVSNPSANPNTLNSNTTNPNIVSSPNVVPMNDTFYRNRNTGDLLLGGTLGYLLGKNRGRNQAEARLEPEVHKLDKKVEALKQKLEDSEMRVRAEVSNSSQNKVVARPNADRIETRQSVEKVEANIENISPANIEAEQKIIDNQERQFEEQLQAMADQELANEAISTKAESGPIRVGELLEPLHKNLDKNMSEASKDVRSMSMAELLEVAEHISLEKTSLRQLYERNRIDSVNLRRVIIEYMNGGSKYEQMLRGSLEAVEMQRELRGEIKRETDFTGSGVASDEDTHTGAITNSLGAKAQQTGQSGQSNSDVNSRAKAPQGDNMPFSNSVAVVLGVTLGIIITILVVLFAS